MICLALICWEIDTRVLRLRELLGCKTWSADYFEWWHSSLAVCCRGDICQLIYSDLYPRQHYVYGPRYQHSLLSFLLSMSYESYKAYVTLAIVTQEAFFIWMRVLLRSFDQLHVTCVKVELRGALYSNRWNVVSEHNFGHLYRMAYIVYDEFLA